MYLKKNIENAQKTINKIILIINLFLFIFLIEGLIVLVVA